jgi:hypothetical protein
MKNMKNERIFSRKLLKVFFPAVLLIVISFYQMSGIEVARATAVDAELLFTPATDTVAVAEDFNLVASVDPNSNDGTSGNPGVNAVELHITFDGSVLDINSITVNSPTFTQLSAPVYDNDAGTATVVVFTTTPVVVPTDVATINFHAVSGATNSPVVFTSESDAAVNDGLGTLVVLTRTPAAVTITGSDSVAPTVTAFVIPASYNNLTVPITTFTATDAVGVTDYCLTEVNDSAGCSWVGTAPTDYTFATGGAHTLYAWARDAVPNVSTSANDSVTIDVAAPTIDSVSSDKAAGTYTVGEVIDVDVTFSESVTSSGDVTVTLETGATDRTCTFTVSNASTGSCNYTVQTGDTSADLTTASISGTIADAATNALVDFTPTTTMETNEAIVIDTTAPTGGSFTIDNDAAEAVSTSVTLNVTCPTDSWATVQMAYGNTASPTNWATCAATASHTLTAGNGAKTVYMRFRDGGLNATSDTTDTITLNIPDIDPPTLSNGSPSGTLAKGTTSTTVGVTTNENATCRYSTSAGIAYASMTDDFTTTGTTTHSFSATGLVDGGSYVYYVRCADGALNPTVSDYAITFSVSSETEISDDHESSSSKKKEAVRKITNSRKNVPRGFRIIHRGNKFSLNSMVALYFSKYGGGYYKPMLVKTSKTGYFRVDYYAAKPKGTYNWYAVNLKTGWKSKPIYYRIKN